MIMISFRTKRDKEDMVYKAKEMEKFAKEFVACLEDGEEEYYDEDYQMRDDMRYRDDEDMHEKPRMRGGMKMRKGRYSY